MFRFLFKGIHVSIALFFPPRCARCTSLIVYRDSLCLTCFNLLEENDLSLVVLQKRCDCCSQLLINMTASLRCYRCSQRDFFWKHYAIMNFSPIIKESIYDLKFRHRYDYKFYWAQKIANYLSRYDKADYQFVLAPSHSSEHLMLAIAKQLMYAHQYKIEFILYKKSNIQQKNLDKVQRMIAQKDNIYLKERDKGRVQGGKWVVLDDMYTTGSTLYYCAKVLMDAGALEVESVSLALVADKI